MTFIRRLKDRLEDRERSVRHGKVVVEKMDLQRLIDAFERDESALRLKYDTENPVKYSRQTLSSAISCLYLNNNEDGNEVLIIVTEVLSRLVKDTEKKKNRLKRDMRI